MFYRIQGEKPDTCPNYRHQIAITHNNTVLLRVQEHKCLLPEDQEVDLALLKGAIKLEFRHRPHLHPGIWERRGEEREREREREREGGSKIVAIRGGGRVVHAEMLRVGALLL